MALFIPPRARSKFLCFLPSFAFGDGIKERRPHASLADVHVSSVLYFFQYDEVVFVKLIFIYYRAMAAIASCLEENEFHDRLFLEANREESLRA